jgi:hypothetical protein
VSSEAGPQASQRPGCFSFRSLLGLLNQPEKAPEKARALAGADAFDLNTSLLTEGNRAFYAVLRDVVPDSAVVFAEVNLAALFEAKGSGNVKRAAQNRVSQRSIDFVICDRITMRPLCGIEVDDRTHRRASRIARDEVVTDLFRFHALPLIRITGAMSYRPEDVRRQLASVLGPATR